MITVYLDVCCLNRPFDDPTQDRVRLEAEAVLLILARINSNEWTWVVSEVMTEEIEATPNPLRRGRVRLLMRPDDRMIVVGAAEAARGRELEIHGFHALDALHLACAEAAAVDVFLTTDDRLLRAARRAAAGLRVQVANPLDWARERTEP